MAVIFLGSVLILVILYLYHLKRQIRKLTKQINKIPLESQYGSRLFIAFREKNMIQLVEKINQMIEQYEGKNAQTNVVKEKLNYSITGLSHDLRTPLTAVKGYLKLLEKTEDSQKRGQYLQAMNQSVTRLTMMADSFYEVAKMETDHQDGQKEPLDFYQRVQESFLFFYEQFVEKGLTVSFPEIAEDVQLNADSVLLTRVIENIIQNCLRYGKNEVQIDFYKADDFVTIQISNDMKQENNLEVERVFDLFYTGNQMRTNTTSSGLGLHVSKKLVEQMNGKLSTNIKEGKFAIVMAFPYK